MASWTLFLGMLCFVSVQKYVKADKIATLGKQIQDKLNKFEKEIPKSSGDKECKEGAKIHADSLKREVDQCIKTKQTDLKARCQKELNKYSAEINTLTEILHGGCKIH
ncbi:uncharacterized protein LOC124367779 [Homalodisca vitripennis]|uniref:uncharacterized protein LOC124367779 n=1 Tax=Homalodisca vitripennis TaxID=197043 RepID=UPI001EEA7FAC|nr:uncharacterized protein LOC124367779 [Homalodisca vitripennis]